MSAATGISAGQLATNGWDAVCAVGASQLSDVFRQQYLQNGPTNPVDPVRLVISDTGGDFLILDVVLGPPELSFPSGLGSDQCQLQMFLVRGAVLQVDLDDALVRSVISVDPRSSWLTGTVALSKAKGDVNAVGQVHLDLAAGAYAPRIAGIDPGSTTAQTLGTALAAYFAGRPSAFLLNTIYKSQVPDCLQPTDFVIVTQSAGDASDDGCVAILIKTNGTPGMTGPLPRYPIPGGDTAALLVSGRVLFECLVAPTVDTQMSELGFGTTYNASLVNGVYAAVGSGGCYDPGPFPATKPTDPYVPYSCNQHSNYAAVTLSPCASSVVASGGGLTFTWTSQFHQYWCMDRELEDGYITDINDAEMVATFTLAYAAAADALTDVVSFSGTGTATIKPQHSGGWYSKWFHGTSDLPGQVQKSLGDALQAALGQLRLPDVDTFALQNLLFPTGQALRLGTVAVPGDLLLSGRVEPALVVSPGLATVAPGASQQFTATLNGESVTAVTWEVTPAMGRVDNTGCYHAPSGGQPNVVVLTAVDQADASTVGRALVLLSTAEPSGGLALAPEQLILTAGEPYDLAVTDAAGQPVDAMCTMSPEIGTLTQGFTTGIWTYKAPATVTEAQTVTVSASAAGGRTGTATIRLAFATQLTVRASAGTVQAGGSVQLTADAEDFDAVSWVIYASGPTGTLTITDGTLSATYNAPPSVTSSQEIAVLAYGYNDDVVGVGVCRLAVEPAAAAS